MSDDIQAEPIEAVPGLSKATLANGLTVYLYHRKDAPLVTARVLFPRGAAASPPGKSGLASLTANLVRRGTRRHDQHEINDLLEGSGTDLGIGVTDDSSRFTLTSEPRTAKTLFRLLVELFREPSFPKREVNSQRDRTRAQLRSSLDDAEWVATRAAYRAAFPGHAYARPFEGFSAEVAKLTRGDVKTFAEEYSASGAVVVLSGAVRDARLPEWLAPFQTLPAGPAQRPAVAAPAPWSGKAALIVDKPDATQAQIRLIGPGFRRGLSDLVPASLGNAVLGEGFSSRLVNEVRVNRGLTYGISSRFETFAVGGMFLVRSFTRLDKVSELVEVVLDQVAQLREKPPTEDELQRARTYQGGAFRLSTETPEQVGIRVADAFRFGLGDDWVARYPQLLEELPRETIAATLALRLPDKDVRVVAVGPARALEKELSRVGPVEVLPLKAVA